MTAVLRLCACVVLAGGLVAGVLTCYTRRPPGPDGTGVDVWDLSATLFCNQAENKRRADELEQVRQEGMWRIEATVPVVRDLLDGRVTLRGAVERVRLIRQRPTGSTAPEPAADEQIARQLLLWCRAELSGADPGRADEVLARLRAEMRGMYCDRPVADGLRDW